MDTTTDTPTLNITTLTDVNEVYRWYPGQNESQLTYVTLDLEDGELSARFDPEISGGSSAGVFHGRIRWYEVAHLTPAALNELLREVAPLAARVLAGSSIDWSERAGTNVGHVDDDAAAAEHELAANLSGYEPNESELVTQWDADDWFTPEGAEVAAARLGLTADTTDAEITQMVTNEEADALANMPGHTILTGVNEYLTEYREALRQPIREDLEEVRDDLAALLTRRRELVRQQAAWKDTDRDSNRTIAKRAGISHTHVARIIDGPADDDHEDRHPRADCAYEAGCTGCE